MDDMKNILLPFEVKDVNPELNAELLKYFTGEFTGFVQAGPKKYIINDKYKEEAFNIYNISVKPDDIFVATFPRSGTTWTQELVWMVANDLDYEKSDAVALTERYVFLESSLNLHPQIFKFLKEKNKYNEEYLRVLEYRNLPACEKLASVPSPRFIKTHLPMSLLPPNLLETGKVVYVARDPQDVIVSYYHLQKSLTTLGYIGDFKTFWKLFINDAVLWAPYFEHIKEAWNKRNDPHMLFLFYEELSKDLPSVIRRVAKFLNKQYSEEQIQKLSQHLSIDYFKNNKSVNDVRSLHIGVQMAGKESFVRKGKSGAWRDYFDKEMIQQTNRWIAENLKNTDFRFFTHDPQDNVKDNQYYELE